MNGRVAHETLQRLVGERPRPNRVHLDGDATFLDATSRRSFADHGVDELFHEATKLTERYRQRRYRTERRLDGSVLGVGLTTDPPRRDGTEGVRLPDDVTFDRTRPTEAESSPTERLTTDRLAATLGRVFGHRSDDPAYASAGALYPVEPYVVTDRSVPESGRFAYAPNVHELRRVADDDDTEFPVSHADTDTFVCLTGVFPRSRARYGERGYRYVLQEAGAVVQRLRRVAATAGLVAEPLWEFDDRAVDATLGVDGVDESVLNVVAVIGA